MVEGGFDGVSEKFGKKRIVDVRVGCEETEHRSMRGYRHFRRDHSGPLAHAADGDDPVPDREGHCEFLWTCVGCHDRVRRGGPSVVRQGFCSLPDAVFNEIHRELDADSSRGGDHDLSDGDGERARGQFRHPFRIVVSVESGAGVRHAAVCDDGTDFRGVRADFPVILHGCRREKIRGEGCCKTAFRFGLDHGEIGRLVFFQARDDAAGEKSER